MVQMMSSWTGLESWMFQNDVSSTARAADHVPPPPQAGLVDADLMAEALAAAANPAVPPSEIYSSTTSLLWKPLWLQLKPFSAAPSRARMHRRPHRAAKRTEHPRSESRPKSILPSIHPSNSVLAMRPCVSSAQLLCEQRRRL